MTEVVTPPVTPEETVAPTPPPTFDAWAKQMMARFMEDEKKWIELASEQNSLLIKALRQSFEIYRNPLLPPLPMTNLFRGWQNFLQAQKLPYPEATIPPAEAPAEKPEVPTARQPFEVFVEFRNSWLNYLSRQNSQFLNTLQQGLGLKEYGSATNLNRWAQQMMDNYVEMQKHWLDMARQFPQPEQPEPEGEIKEVTP